jgi:hypothetical protein
MEIERLREFGRWGFFRGEGRLHAATSFVSSPFPVFDIWRAHLYANTDEQLAQIDLAKGSQCVLISRTGTLETAVTLLGPGDAALLTALAGHLPFGVACEAAVLAEPGFDLGFGIGKLALTRALAAFVGTCPQDEEPRLHNDPASVVLQ